jgi:omega-6 fatty acid desaturase (delta-12 desaturase)
MSQTQQDARSINEHWRKVTKPYCGPETRQSVAQLATAAALFLLSWTGMYFALSVGYWLTLLLAIPTAMFVVFLFMIQHDCGHGSYFKSRAVADWVGFFIGVVTLTPYEYWRRTHAYHHSHSGDLDFRGFGDIRTITVAEYDALTPTKKLHYRIYRNPIVLLTIGPAFHFICKHRYPWDIPASWTKAWQGVWWTNLALAIILLIATYTIGLGTFLMIQIPVSLIACSMGVWLFYVQHQYEESYWHKHEEWDYYDAAIKGSSHLVLPKPLQWLTANIGLHHVHHLNSQIPNYKLQECLDSSGELQQATKITVFDTWRLFHLTLWDEAQEKMITFRELRARG